MTRTSVWFVLPTRFKVVSGSSKVCRRGTRRLGIRIARRTYWVSPALAMVLLLSPIGTAKGQDTCPYDEDDAVADTLDPSGYYPLQLGNVWEYVAYSGPFLSHLIRDEVIADTVIDGNIFYKVRRTSFNIEEHQPITTAAYSYSILSIAEGVLLSWSSQYGLDELVPLSRDFSSCYETVLGTAIVAGSYATTYTFESGEMVGLTATKEFTLPVAGYEYGHGLGNIRGWGDGGATMELSYARVDGVDYGVRLDSLFDIRVGIEVVPDLLKGSRVNIYPNPASSVAHIWFMLARPGQTSLRIYDIQGRLVATPLQGRNLTAGKHTIAWNVNELAPGVYFVRLLMAADPIAKVSLVIARQD